MESALSTMSIMPTTKDQIVSFANKLKAEIESGEVNTLDVIKMQKSIEKMFDSIKGTITEYARAEAEKHGKSFQFKGAKIDLVEVGVKYDFTECGHLDYNELCETIEKLNEQKKNFEAMIKTFKEPQNLISINGEAMTVYPPKKTSTSSIKVTF